MKKNRMPCFLLLSVLLAALLLPTAALAAEGSGSAILDGMHIEATAAILVDDDNREVLYEQSAHEKRYPASITKVMTALLTLEAVEAGKLSMDQVITVGDSLHQGIGEGGSTQDIKVGEMLTVRDLLYCALLPSANEACNVLGAAVAGSVDAFVEQMNLRAAELGMEDTHFTNTHGYHDDEHYTTAWDIYLMCSEAMGKSSFREIVSSKSYVVPATNLREERTLHDTNALVSTFRIRGYYYEYATGIKTGSTPEAGYCLASAATKEGKNLIAVVLGAENPKNTDGSTNRLQFSESSRLLDWGFRNFSRRTIIDASAMDIAEVAVTLSQEASYVTVQPSGSIEATLPNDLELSQFKREVNCIDTVEAPVEKGQVLGTIKLTYNGTDYGTLDLVAVNDVSRSELLYRLDRIQKFLDQTWVKLAALGLILLILILIVRHLVVSRHRSRYGGGRRGGRGSHYAGSGRRRR